MMGAEASTALKESRNRKRVSLTKMPMQSKAKQQLMDENPTPMQPKESEAAKILSQNEARSKRYYERIDAAPVQMHPRLQP